MLLGGAAPLLALSSLWLLVAGRWSLVAGVGELVLSGMTQSAKVIGFLNLADCSKAACAER